VHPVIMQHQQQQQRQQQEQEWLAIQQGLCHTSRVQAVQAAAALVVVVCTSALRCFLLPTSR
jgi:hypothetical protein